MDGRARLGILAGLCVAGAAALAAVATLDAGGSGHGWLRAPASIVAAVADAGQRAGAPPGGGAAVQGRDVDPGPRETVIVLFREPAVAAYRGGVAGLAAPARSAGARGARLDMRSPQARAYARHLLDRQRAIEAGIVRAIGRPLQVSQRFQHAVNGVVAELDAAEVARVRAMPDVLLVDGYREYPLDTDTGPALIGAPAVWSGDADGGSGHNADC